MITREVEIDGKKVRFGASAALPRLYRVKFRRDLMRDLGKLSDALAAQPEGVSLLDIPDLEVFENVAYMMAKHADPEAPDSPEDWLAGFGVFSIYTVLPQLLELWGFNMETLAEAKKNLPGVAGN